MTPQAVVPDLGRTIRSYRDRADWTQKRLAEAAGVSRDAISKYEHGHRLPEWPTLLAIAAALGFAIVVVKIGEELGAGSASGIPRPPM